jgi:DNA-binding NarL/FixJ family response regulator
MRDLFSETEWLGLSREFGFTPQELEVAKSLFDEKKADEIAVELGASQEAVSQSIEQLLSKSGTTSPMSFVLRLYAAIRAWENPPESGQSRNL